MMRFLLIAVLLFPAAAFAQAEEEGDTKDYSTEIHQQLYKDEITPTIYPTVNFESIAQQAIDQRPKNFSFRFLRSLYIQTAQYEPTAEDINRQLVTHAYVIQNSDDWIETDKSLEAFHNLVRDHLANIGVIEQALELSRQDPRFGDPKLYQWVRDGLLRELMDSGDGKTPRGSYDITTLEEEDYLIAQLGYEVLSRETSHAGMKYYNMLEVGDPATGEEFTLFIDATFPLTKIQKEQDQPAYAIGILPQ